MAKDTHEAPKAIKDADERKGDETAPEVQVTQDTKASNDKPLVPGEVSTHEGDVPVRAGEVDSDERLFPDEPASANNPLLRQVVSVPPALADRFKKSDDKK